MIYMINLYRTIRSQEINKTIKIKMSFMSGQKQPNKLYSDYVSSHGIFKNEKTGFKKEVRNDKK